MQSGHPMLGGIADDEIREPVQRDASSTLDNVLLPICSAVHNAMRFYVVQDLHQMDRQDVTPCGSCLVVRYPTQHAGFRTEGLAAV